MNPAVVPVAVNAGDRIPAVSVQVIAFAVVTASSQREFVGGLPAPPPFISTPVFKIPEDAQADVLEKYGTPPLVPATVKAGVVVGVPTETMPPVNPTLVTVPALPARVVEPSELYVAVIFVPALIQFPHRAK